MIPIELLKLGSELKSTLSIGKLFQIFMTRSPWIKTPDSSSLAAPRLK